MSLSADFTAVMDWQQEEEYVPPSQPADSYNGASHENFTWSQSISDLDVLVHVPPGLTNLADLRVDVSSRRIKVEARKNALRSVDRPDNNLQQKDNDPKIPKASDNSKEWITIFEGEFSFPTKKDESLWSLTPGSNVNV